MHRAWNTVVVTFIAISTISTVTIHLSLAAPDSLKGQQNISYIRQRHKLYTTKLLVQHTAKDIAAFSANKFLYGSCCLHCKCNASAWSAGHVTAARASLSWLRSADVTHSRIVDIHRHDTNQFWAKESGAYSPMVTVCQISKDNRRCGADQTCYVAVDGCQQFMSWQDGVALGLHRKFAGGGVVLPKA